MYYNTYYHLDSIDRVILPGYEPDIEASANFPAISVPAGGTLEADPTTLVNSPIASACYACHDAPDARKHMISNGAWLNQPRASIGTYAAGVATVAPVNQEQCLVCHGSGALADIKAVHMNF